MKMYLPFGDWSDDGHGKYKQVLIEAPSMEHLFNAQKIIKEKYGQDFFRDMAEKYEEPHFTLRVWHALMDADYPIDRFIKVEEVNDWEGMTSFEEVLEEDHNPILSINFVIDAFIWLLNAHGAEIIPSDEDIPMICNWTCRDFETVGYGCFWLQPSLKPWKRSTLSATWLQRLRSSSPASILL